MSKEQTKQIKQIKLNLCKQVVQTLVLARHSLLDEVDHRGEVCQHRLVRILFASLLPKGGNVVIHELP